MAPWKEKEAVMIVDEEVATRKNQATERIVRIRERLIDTDPVVCAERALIWTESYKTTEHLPQVLRAAIALRETLAKMSIHINDDELLVGNQGSGLRSAPLHPQINTWFLNELDLFEKRKGSRFLIPEESKKALRREIPYWAGKNVYDRTIALLPEDMLRAMDAFVFTCNYTLGKGTGHFLLNFERVLNLGFQGIKAEVERKATALALSNPDDLDKITFCRAVMTVCDAVTLFAERYAVTADALADKEQEPLRKGELQRLAQICRRVPAHPATSYYEALQSMWFVQLIAQIESDGTGISLGRIDRILYPYYARDIESGTVTREFAAELMDSFWLKLSEIIEIWPQEDTRFFGGHPISQTITLGGTEEDGTDSTNELSYVCLDSLEKLRLPQPSVCVRVHKNSPHEFLVRCAEVARLGLGMPAFYSDEVAIPSLIRRGIPVEHARSLFGIAGCVEMGIQGKMCHFANSGYFSLLKVLELTLFNGIDPLSGEQLGPQTGDVRVFSDFEEFLRAYKTQISYFLRMMVAVTNVVNTMHGRFVTLPFISSFTDDCVARLKEVHDGGALYNHDGPQGVGLADTADSLAVIKKLVYEERELSVDELITAMSADFVGFEEMRRRIRKIVPRYGNNKPYVDSLARDVASYFCKEVEKHRNPRGGLFVPGLYSVSANVPIGKYIGATPNGRGAREPVAEACSPTHGSEQHGPTQAALSVAHLDHLLATNGTQYNQKFLPSALAGTKGLHALVDLIKTFFAEGGYHIQFNVISAQKLRDAQKHPEKYRDLVIRVAGYSAFFVDLDVSIQEDIIQRTEMQFN